jgi:hypothetical protein
MLQCFLNCPGVSEEHPFALDCDAVATAQSQDAAVLLGLASRPQSFGRFEMSEGANIVCHAPGPDQPFKTCIPDAMLNDIIYFYHLALNHVGMSDFATPLHFISVIHDERKTLRTSCVNVTPVNNANCLVEDTAILLQELPMSHHGKKLPQISSAHGQLIHMVKN